MGKGGGKQTIGFRYYMSLLMGLSRGPLDEIVQIKVGDLCAWPNPDGEDNKSGLFNRVTVTVAQGPGGVGVRQFDNGNSVTVDGSEINTVSGTGEYRVDAPELFGGDKKEGGIVGAMRVMMGAASQIVPNYIKQLMGGYVPDFRGVVTVYFDGLLTSLNPYPKKWEFRVRRTTSGWDGWVWQEPLATIWMRGGSVKAMNPAHIVYECITNRDWGRGMARNSLDGQAFADVAQTLFDEGLGLCLRYNRQSELSTFIQDVLDQMGGALYPDRSTGRLALSLLRGGYDVESLPLFTYDSGLIALEDAETATQEDVRNEVIVKWVDPVRKEERSARVQNIASMQTMGAKNSTTVNYAGVPDVDLALRLGQRDLKANANSLKRYKVMLDRRAWRVTPGSLFRISVPQRNIFNAVLRAGKVSEAGGSDGRITVEAVLDVFGLPAASFISAQENEWSPPDRSAMIANVRSVREATYAELAVAMDPANLAILDPSFGAIATVVGKPSPMSQAYRVRAMAEGETAWARGSGAFAPYLISPLPISRYQSEVPFTAGMDIGLITVGSMVKINAEIGEITDLTIDPITGDGTLTISRGCVDTLPVGHPADSIMFVVADEVGGDGREYASGENVDVKILPYTSTNTLAIGKAPINTVTIRGRQGRPYPPGNMRVNGTLYGNFTGVATDTISLTWAHRDRVSQQDKLVGHQAASIGPEPGVTYTVRVYNGNPLASPVRTVTGINSAGFDYTAAMASADNITASRVFFEVEAVRGIYTSLSKYSFGVDYTYSVTPVDETVVEVSNPGTSVFGTGAYTRVPFLTETTDTENAFSSNDRYTVPSAGNYRFVMSAVFDGASQELPASSEWRLKIDNFTSPATGNVAGQTATGTFNGSSEGSLDVTIALSAGAVVSAYLRHNGGADITVAAATLEIIRLA